jgi:hypothetical protein
MSKYDPLGDYLRKQQSSRIPMTFAEIERLIRAKLPNSQRYPAWWSNNPFNNVMTKVWLEAGFMTENVDVEGRKLVFRRAKRSPSSNKQPPPSSDSGGSSAHPLIGWMKGTVRIAPGVDLTQPADPDWGKRTWGNKK